MGKPKKNTTTNNVKLVYSSDCESCIDKCGKGIEYLRVFEIKKEGKGVVCKK